jgi:hypothetical protein
MMACSYRALYHFTVQQGEDPSRTRVDMVEFETSTDENSRRRVISVFKRDITMPRSRRSRIAIGVTLMILGVFGFLPVLGFWMIPVGMLILSYEFAIMRRLRRRIVKWWERRRRPKSQ